MPYNNAPISPTEDITGAVQLPLARIKKILHVDEDIGPVSANAAFAITIATELFIQYFADQAMNIVKAEKKPRRNIQYKDLANAVSRIDNLEFLSDVVPKTSTYREYKASKARKAQEARSLPNGQTTLDPSRRSQQHSSNLESVAVVEGSAPTETHTQSQDVLGNPPRANEQRFIFEHYDPTESNGNMRKDEMGDVIMGQSR